MLKALVIAIIVFAAFCIGVWYGKSQRKNQANTTNAGSIIINTTDPEKDTVRIELEIPIVQMIEENTITFKVVNEDES